MACRRPPRSCSRRGPIAPVRATVVVVAVVAVKPIDAGDIDDVITRPGLVDRDRLTLEIFREGLNSHDEGGFELGTGGVEDVGDPAPVGLPSDHVRAVLLVVPVALRFVGDGKIRSP